MLKVVAKNFIQKDKLDETIKLYEELIYFTRKEEGCIKYELYQDEKDPTILCMIEEWENEEAFDKHTKSEHFLRIVPQLKKLRTRDSDLNVYKKLI